MILSSIAMGNKMLFRGFVPDHILDCIGREYRFGLGLLEKTDSGMSAAGAVIFDVSEGGTDMGNIVAAWILWFYVNGRYRQKGVAKRLFAEMYDILERAGVAFVYADIPVDERYDFVCSYLKKRNFIFCVSDKYELLTTLGTIRNAPRMPKKMAENICPLAEVSAVQFKEYLTAVRRNKEPVDARLTWEKRNYEEQVSCCYVRDGKVKGALLLQKTNDVYLEVLHMRTLENNPGVLTGMMAHSVAYAAKHYKDDVSVNILTSLPQAKDIMEYLFPTHVSLCVRRGKKELKKEECVHGQ